MSNVNKYGKTFNCSVLDYNKLRTFLRYAFLYGCYTKDDFVERLNYSESLVDKDYKRLLSILGAKHFKKKTPKQTRFRMNYNYYQNTENYLVKSYYAKSSTKLQISLYFLILQILKREMDVNEINGKIPTLSDDFNIKTLTRQLDKMAQWDLIEKVQHKRNGKLYYRPKKDFFAALTDDELGQLKTAVEFFCNIEFPSIPGYYLSNTIEKYMKYYREKSASSKNIFLYRFKNFHTVLEEDTAWKLLWCINNSIEIKLQYFFKNGIGHKVIMPRRLVIDIYYGRWYLIGSTDMHPINIYRLDKIIDFEILKSSSDTPYTKEELDNCFRHSWCIGTTQKGDIPSIIRIRFSVSANEDLTFLLNKVKREGKWGTITDINDKSFIYTIKINDAKEIKPWIRSFGHYAEVIESTLCDLREELHDEWGEMLESYGIIS
ncbi:helix-turn-helix transcriptional regulator [Lutispora sp.]|uniref:helix-turn-helix transcriptional regulator n=1 Tax=Lutispora sp. TaxID=2828727 RepID=UPI002B1FE7EA|nr:WYL domain-containing protein [Lutispora sp.]MEA4962911.1 WYL domain-containing protein [Lutispora sp.]